MAIQETLPHLGPRPSAVEATITGQSEDEILALLDRYFTEYPESHYGTRVTRPATYLGGDLWEARVERNATTSL